MRPRPQDDNDAINRYVHSLRPRHRTTPNVYRCILRGFERFVRQHGLGTSVDRAVIEAWLQEHAARWPIHLVLHRARIVDRFLDFLAAEGSIPNNPLAQLRIDYGQRCGTPIVRALLTPDPAQALEALRPLPRFASFLGGLLREHVELMRAVGYRYDAQAGRLLRFDRFLQGRPDLVGKPPAVLLQQWAAASPTLRHAWECHQTRGHLARAWQRIDPGVEFPKPDQQLARVVAQHRRHPYLYTPQEVRLLLDTAREFPSPRAPLRPLAMYTMLVLAYCAGLRLGELVRLDLSDVDLAADAITIRQTKFFKSRTLPLADGVMTALREYLDARRHAGAPQDGSSALFWHAQRAGRYSRVMAEKLLVRALRRAGLKPEQGRVGPRVHDLRHAFVLHRMLAWYGAGINPEARLPYLATYLGHKDIKSTLTYLTVTPALLQQAAERFRAFAAQSLHAAKGARP
jgi:integrase